MNPMTRLTTALVLSGISATIAYAQSTVTPEVLFSDDFESGSMANWPFSATTNSTVNSVVYTSSVAPSVVSATGTDVVHSGTKACKTIGRNGNLPLEDPLNIARVRLGAGFSRPQATNETVLLTFYYWDMYGQPGYTGTGLSSTTNHRYYVELRDAITNGNPFSGTYYQQLAMGCWNQATNVAPVPGTSVNGGWFGAAPSGQSLTTYYAARMVSVTFGNNSGFASTTNVTATGNTAPNWTYMGIPNPVLKRSNGWKKMTIAYSIGRPDNGFGSPVVGVGEYFVNSNKGFWWTHNATGLNGSPIRGLDSVVLNGSENPAVDTYIDDFSVRAFPEGSMQLLPILGDTVSGANISTIPFSVSMTPTNGNTNAAVSAFTVSTNAAGELNIQLPQNVRGSYDLSIDGGSWLRKTVAVTMTDHGIFEQKIPMQNGDVDGSGEVDAVDIDSVIANFGQTGVGPTNGDVDLSDEVDAVDIDIVIANFGGVDN